MSINLIWAQNERGVIGVDGDLPWHIPEDLAHFRSLTRGKTVIMGRATWDSLPEKVRPLPGRRNIVLSRDPKWGAVGAERAHSIEDALEIAAGEEVWVMGGGEIYRQFLGHATRCEITRVDLPGITGTTGNAHAPELGPQWTRVNQDPELGWHMSQSNIRYRFESYTRISVNER